jgi:hypothetical protein
MKKQEGVIPSDCPRAQYGINMVDLMMWLVIAALLLAAAIQSIGYYQKSAYVYQMNAAVEVAAGKVTALAATDGTVITDEIIDRVISEENTATPNDQITLYAGSLASYASGVGAASEYGFARTAVTTATSSQSQYIKATHDGLTDRESSYFFQATASYKAGVNVVNSGVLETPVAPEQAPTPTATETTAAPTPTPTATETTPVATPTPTPTPTETTPPVFPKYPEWTQATGAGIGTNVWYGVAISSNGMRMAVAPSIDAGVGNNGGHIRTSADGGVTWTEQTGSPYANWRSVASSPDGSMLVAGRFGGTMHISRDYGVTWTAATGAGSGNWYAINIIGDGKDIFAASYTGNLQISHDYGVTWTKLTNGIPGTVGTTPAPGTGHWYAIGSDQSGRKLIAGKYGGYSYISNDYGVTWTENTAAGIKNWTRFGVSADGSKVVATNLYNAGSPTTTGRVVTSDNFGASWTEQAGAGVANWSGVAMSADGTKIIAGQVGNANSTGLVRISVDSGVTWSTQEGVTSGTYYNVGMTPDGSRMIAGNAVPQQLFTGVIK